MTYPSVVLKRAVEQLNKRREENKQITRQKKEQAYIQMPELLEINKKIGALVKLSVASQGNVAEAKKILQQLVAEREKILLAHGYPANYLEER